MSQIKVTEIQTRALKLAETAIAHHFRTHLKEFCPRRGFLRRRPVSIDWIHINFSDGADHGLTVTGQWVRIQALIELNNCRIPVETITIFDDETKGTSSVIVHLPDIGLSYGYDTKRKQYRCGKILPILDKRHMKPSEEPLAA